MVVTTGDIDAHVGLRLRQRRESLGVSQGRLGKHLGLTFSQIQKYEKGTNRIGAGRLFLIANYLGTPVQYFFEGLEGGPGTGSAESGRGVQDSELAELDEEFASIDDSDARQAVLALIRSLATSPNAAGSPKLRMWPASGGEAANAAANPARKTRAVGPRKRRPS